MLDGYLRVDVEGRAAYVRRDGVGTLREVSALLFDCDGVLIDARASYNRSISRTASYLAGELLGASMPEAAITERVIYAFRKSGGFNNDWDTTYAILLYLFTRLPKQIRDRFQFPSLSFEREGALAGLSERLSGARRLVASRRGVIGSIEDIEGGLLNLAEKADSRGLASIERVLSEDVSKDELEGFARVVSHPGEVGVSLVTTVFEEFFLGLDLFARKYGIRPQFVRDAGGLVADERPLVGEETLVLLTEKFGRSGLGIVSGRSRLTAEYTLGERLERFNPAMLVFVEDDIAAALRAGQVERARGIGKPSPYGLLKAEEAAPKSGRILYVGDSKEDLIMVERANHITDRFVAGGIYGSAISPEELRDLFMDDGAYLIAETVDDLYRLFTTVEGCEGD